MLRRNLKWIALALVVVAVAAWGLLRLQEREAPVVEASRRELEQRLVATGRVLPPARVELGALASGNVVRLHVDEGHEVQAGQLLLELDATTEQAAMAQARAALAEAQARLEQLRSVALPRARAAVRRAAAELEQTRRQAERYRQLFDRGALSQSSLDDAERRLAVAQAELQQAQLQVAGIAGGAEERVAAAAVANAEASLELAQAQLDRTRILAPVAGTVLARQVEVGDAVRPGQALFTLGASGPTEIEIEPDERNLAWLERGQQALVAADAFPDRPFAAVVRRIAPAVDETRGTVEVRLAVPEPPPFLRPEMTVSADLQVARREAALVLPAEAVRDRGTERPWVLVVEEGRARRRELRLGLRGERFVEVLEGVGEGQQVILPGAGVEAGERVVPRLVRQGG